MKGKTDKVAEPVEGGAEALLERILETQELILDSLEELKAPGAGGTRPRPAIPGGTTVGGGPVDPALVDEALALIGDLGGSGPRRSLVERWLRGGYTPQEIADAVDAALEPFREKAQAEGVPGKNWRANAAYLLGISHGSGGWVQVGNNLRGIPDNPIVSPDPLPNLLAGLPRHATPADMTAIVPEVLRRAEEGIDWTGQRRRTGAELEKARARVEREAWPAEWLAFRDPRLVKVLGMTNELELERHSFSQPKDLTTLMPQSLEEWLWQQKKQSNPWAAADEVAP